MDANHPLDTDTHIHMYSLSIPHNHLLDFRVELYKRWRTVVQQ